MKVTLDRWIQTMVSDHGLMEIISALPLFHFLHGMSHPYQPPPRLHHTSPEWWGLSLGIQTAVNDARLIAEK